MRKSQSFSNTCINANIVPQSHVIESKIISVTKDKMDFLKLKEGDNIIYVKRLRSADGIPVILEELFFPEKLFKNFDISKLEDSSLFELLEAYLYYEKAFERIVNGCPAAEWEDDEYNLDEV